MSDKDKKQSSNKGGDNVRQGGGDKGKNSSNGRSERSETTREEWNKIDKKGQGAGDRPKR